MKQKIAIVISRYYDEIADGLTDGALRVLNDHGIRNHTSCNQIYVPGAFEIPVTIAKNIDSYNAFIAIGCIIKGKTPHFDFISTAITNAIMSLSIAHKKPIGNGIITCLNKKQALKRAKPRKKNKGSEAAIAVLSVLKILKDNYEPS